MRIYEGVVDTMRMICQSIFSMFTISQRRCEDFHETQVRELKEKTNYVLKHVLSAQQFTDRKLEFMTKRLTAGIV